MSQINSRILIVDDNPTIREDFRRILSPSDSGEDSLAAIEAELFDDQPRARQPRPDFQLAFAAQGESAAQLVSTAMEQNCPFAVAIVDVRMPPGIDGVQTVKQLWRIQSDLQIVLCTAYSEYSWSEIVEELGISHRLVVLKKPFDPIEVMQLCQAMTTKWSTEREMALRQLDLQSKLAVTSQRAEKISVELHSERKKRQGGVHVEDSQSMDTMSALASGIAHDFNNALTVIQGHISAALMDPHHAPSMEVPLEQVMQAAQRASQLSRQMMALTAEADSPTELRTLNLIPLVKQQVEILQRVMKDRVHLEVLHHENEVLAVAADTVVHRLVNTLCIRAREMMPHGGNLNITIKSQLIESAEQAANVHNKAQPGRYSVLRFDDTSLTKNPEANEQSCWIEPGRTQDNSRVATATNLAEKIGGWLTVETAEGVGCSYNVYLPAVANQQPAPTSSSSNHVPMSGLVVLVVDDEPTVCDIIAYVLSRQGHQVIKANHAMEAWTVWQSRNHQIDLLIADIYLPDGMTGFELARHMRANVPELPVIYMSGYHPDLFLDVENLTVGVNYLSKPFDVMDLLNAAAKTLESSHPEKEDSSLPHAELSLQPH